MRKLDIYSTQEKQKDNDQELLSDAFVSVHNLERLSAHNAYPFWRCILSLILAIVPPAWMSLRYPEYILCRLVRHDSTSLKLVHDSVFRFGVVVSVPFASFIASFIAHYDLLRYTETRRNGLKQVRLDHISFLYHCSTPRDQTAVMRIHPDVFDGKDEQVCKAADKNLLRIEVPIGGTDVVTLNIDVVRVVRAKMKVAFSMIRLQIQNALLLMAVLVVFFWRHGDHGIVDISDIHREYHVRDMHVSCIVLERHYDHR